MDSVSVKRIDTELPMPSRAHPGDGAIDLRSTVSFKLAPGEQLTVKTGIAVAIPYGFAGFVIPRSGLAARHGISIVNAPGLIDAGYRGEIAAVLINLGKEEVAFERGDRIAQLAIVPVSLMPWVEVEDLDDTSRAAGGFGSSGVS